MVGTREAPRRVSTRRTNRPPPDGKERIGPKDGLFDENGVGKTHKVRKKYDPDFGYPTCVFLDCQKTWPRRIYP